MNKATLDLLISMLLTDNEYQHNYIYDDEVNECLFKMYLFMMCEGVDKEREEKFYKEFCDLYRLLNDEQKEIVKNDYLEICDAQVKSKVKKKGMINYE